MQDKSKIFITIPAYNESGKIKDVVRILHDKGFTNIVVVDDGSKDDTYSRLSSTKGIFLLKHIINRGQGAALQTAQKFALLKGAEHIVHFDADGQHNPDEIMKQVEILQKERCDIVIGSRFLGKDNKSNVPFKKVLLLKMGIIFTWFTSGIRYTDTHNGFRVMTRKGAEKLTITFDRFEHASEILNNIRRQGVSYVEAPVTIEYTEYSKAKGQKISNSINILLNILYKDILDILS